MYTPELHHEIDVIIFNEVNDTVTLTKEQVIEMHREIERQQKEIDIFKDENKKLVMFITNIINMAKDPKNRKGTSENDVCIYLDAVIDVAEKLLRTLPTFEISTAENRQLREVLESISRYERTDDDSFDLCEVQSIARAALGEK
jgi:hypothetical protein